MIKKKEVLSKEEHVSMGNGFSLVSSTPYIRRHFVIGGGWLLHEVEGDCHVARNGPINNPSGTLNNPASAFVSCTVQP